jgi:hypothetical protein
MFDGSSSSESGLFVLLARGFSRFDSPRTRSLAHGVLLGALLGCAPEEPPGEGSPPDESEVTAARTQAIHGARRMTDSNANPWFPQVVAILDSAGQTVCSGTIVSRTHVLSAGHCSGVAVSLDTPINQGAGPLENRSFRVVAIRRLSDVKNSGRDLALFLLDHALTIAGSDGASDYAVPPAPLATSFETTANAWTVGYGRACDNAATGVRRALLYAGHFREYPTHPGVLTRRNVGCGDASYAGPDNADDGGPLLDASRRIVGVFSGWSCRRASDGTSGSGCEGTIEWTRLHASNLGWVEDIQELDFDNDNVRDRVDPYPALNCNAQRTDPRCARPDFRVERITWGRCMTGGGRAVDVTVRNAGTVAGWLYVDVFGWLERPPPIGTTSTFFARSDTIAPGLYQVVTVPFHRNASVTTIDVLLDTTGLVREIDEGNNHGETQVQFPPCPAP